MVSTILPGAAPAQILKLQRIQNKALRHTAWVDRYIGILLCIYDIVDTLWNLEWRKHLDGWLSFVYPENLNTHKNLMKLYVINIWIMTDMTDEH